MSTPEFHDYVMKDLFAHYKGISSKRMFSGWGIYKDGVIFGLILNDQLYFKVDETTRKQYQSLGSKPFIYSRSEGKSTVTSYWIVPPDILDNSKKLEEWMNTACEVSVRSKKKK